MIGLDMSSHLTAVIPLAMSNIYIVHCWRRIACEWGLETADNEWVSLVLSSVPCRMYITFICILPQDTYIVFYMQYKMYILFQFQYAFFISAFIVKDSVLIGYKVWILWKEILKQKYIWPVSAETNKGRYWANGP